MNIFALDKTPKLAAQYHNDRHVVKMILETAQLLCTAHHFLDGERAARAHIGKLVLRPTHINHPCAKWVREGRFNYEWAFDLGCALLLEYRARYQKVHAYEGLYERLETLPWNIPYEAMQTPFEQCMPAQYKRDDAIEAYRLYYFHEKKHLASWKAPAKTPKWWQQMEATTNDNRAVQHER